MRAVKYSSTAEMQLDNLSSCLLAWYDDHRRVMPWRVPSGETPDAYPVWLSEIMLQQTTVATVGPYFERFLARWPTVADLAAAELDEVLHMWAGLGYYARARNLHKCAKYVSEEYGGHFPNTEVGLLKLPGIGPYTAAAIATIAFGRKATVVDGNVERVMARLFAVTDPLPRSKGRLRELAAGLTPDTRCGDYAQATMDLGATICLPAKPACSLCPWREDCKGKAGGIAADLPRKLPKKKRPTRYGVAFWLVAEDGSVLLRRRPEKGLLGGMMEVPSTEWHEDIAPQRINSGGPVDADWQPMDGLVRHTFTHFHLELCVHAAVVRGKPDLGGVWCPPNRFGDYALPTVMKKIVRIGMGSSISM
ncbi:MAG: Adenine DNA glycosylase [Alphaproteobacteria bacterium MarineAlpha11_Bin1]|nr:MAG: Adenine DNA glycosylase [Alphaproteobacteria bacterium MarineAlpha11_Bin1]|tara:strand:- start:5 stop:1093 length:1089 start_codon:yes stop_codon:yes gene_type:complete